MDKRQWKKVFFHNSSTQVFFTDDEYHYANTPEKLNLLGNITEKDKINGFYEFALEYVEYGILLFWKQKKNIVDTTNKDTSSTLGYVGAIGKYFGGISKSDCPKQCLYEGVPPDIHGGWWDFAVGAKTYYKQSNKFPGIYYGEGESPEPYIVSVVSLYLKRNIPLDCKITRNISNTFFASILFIFIQTYN